MRTRPSRMNWDPTRHYKAVGIAESYDRIRFSSIPGRVFENLERNNILKAFRSVPQI